MQRHSILGALALCAAVSHPLAQGGAAIITLASPPPGGDGHSALQSGTAAATGVASAWHNPALLTGLGVATGSHVHFATAPQDLWFGGDQTFSGVAVSYPGLGGDFGIAVYRNTTDFGVFSTDSLRAEESVYGLAAGLGLGRFASAGFAAKYFRSDIGDARAVGWAFDLGASSSKRFRPLQDLASVEVTPRVGVALRNLGPEVSYVDPEMSDPLPRAWSNGLGLQVDFADILQLTLAYDLEREVHHRARWSDPWQKMYGYTASVLGFRYGEASLRDPAGERFERHVMREYEFNYQRLQNVLARVRGGDFASASAPAALAGTGLRVNPRVVVGYREIESGVRRGQDSRYYFSLSL